MKQRGRQLPAKGPDRSLRTAGICSHNDLRELVNGAALERANRFGCRGLILALLVQLVERHRNEVEKESTSASR